MYGTLTYEKKGNIAVITLNRPEVLNALNDQSFPEISRAFGEAECGWPGPSAEVAPQVCWSRLLERGPRSTTRYLESLQARRLADSPIRQFLGHTGLASGCHGGVVSSTCVARRGTPVTPRLSGRQLLKI